MFFLKEDKKKKKKKKKKEKKKKEKINPLTYISISFPVIASTTSRNQTK